MISFVIITDNKEPKKLEKTIQSIKDLKIPNADLVLVEDRFLTGRLGQMRNEGCTQTTNPILVVADDDIYFHDDFFKGLQKFWDECDDRWDVLSCRILNPDGSRYWDWKINENGLNELLPYDQTHPNLSLTGGLTIMRRQVWEAVQWDNNRGFYQEEDVDWTKRVKEAGFEIAFNPYSSVTHDAPYKQVEKWVVKID